MEVSGSNPDNPILTLLHAQQRSPIRRIAGLATHMDSAKRLVETLGSFDSCFDGFLQKAQKKKESYLDQTFRMRGSRRRLKFNSRSTVAAVGFIPRESSPTM